MEFSFQTNNDVCIVGLKGRLDFASSDELKESFASHLQSTRNFIFDCRELEFLDSTGLGVLLLCLKEVMKKGGDIRLNGLGDAVKIVMEITRADDIFNIYETVEEAVASYDATGA